MNINEILEFQNALQTVKYPLLRCGRRAERKQQPTMRKQLIGSVQYDQVADSIALPVLFVVIGLMSQINIHS